MPSMPGVARADIPWRGRSHRVLGVGVTLVGVSALVSALGLGLVTVRAAHAAGSTVTVCASGCDYATINAAVAASNTAPGTISTIQVKAGTYSEPDFTITSPVNLVGAGAASSIIEQPMSASGNITIKPTSAGNTTISGFTIEGNGTNAGVRPILVTSTDTNASDTVTISDNAFVETASAGTSCPGTDHTSTDSCQPYDFSIGFYNSGNGVSNATTDVTGNTFTGLWQAVLSENAAGVLSVTGNQVSGLLPSTDVIHGATVAQNPQAIFDFAHSTSKTIDVTQLQTISGNTLSGFAGLGIGVFAGFNLTAAGGTDGGPGAFGSVSITNNTLALSGTVFDNPKNQPGAILVEGNDNGTIGNATVSGNIIHTTPDMPGIGLQGEPFASDLTLAGGSITANAVYASATSATDPEALGMLIGFVTSTAPVSVSENLISLTASGGGQASDVYSGFNTHAFTAHQNCLIGTVGVTVGAQELTGPAPDESNNWWGASSGPQDVTNNPTGKGTIATGVTDTPFLTSLAAPCAGPTITNAKTSSNPATAGASLTLSGTATGVFPVVSAQYNIDGGSYKSMNASNGSFGATTQGLTAALSAFSGAGTHTICEKATDNQGYTGAASCFTLTVSGTGLSGNGNPPSAPQTAQAPSTSGATTGASANGSGSASKAPATTAQPKSVAAAITQPGSGVPLWLVVLLAVFGFMAVSGGTVLLMRGRAR